MLTELDIIQPRLYFPFYFDKEDRLKLIQKDPQELAERTGVVTEYTPWNFETVPYGRYSYVIMPNLEFRFSLISEAGAAEPMLRHHELARGQGVVAAGMIEVSHGKIAYFSNESGHYTPSPDCLPIALQVMKQRLRIPMTDNVQFGIFGRGSGMGPEDWRAKKLEVSTRLQGIDPGVRIRR